MNVVVLAAVAAAVVVPDLISNVSKITLLLLLLPLGIAICFQTVVDKGKLIMMNDFNFS